MDTIIAMGIESRKTFADEVPEGLFISRAFHTTLRLALLDCQFGVLTEDWSHLKSEVGYISRALDSYIILQFQGFYKILDDKFKNVIQKHNLRAAVGAEAAPRNKLLADFANEKINHEAYNEWQTALLNFLKLEGDVLMPFESRLRADATMKMLVQSGNDWEYMVRFIFAKLEQHKKWNMLGSLASEVQETLKHCTPLETERIIPVIMSSLSTDALSKLLSVGIDVDPEHGIGGSEYHGPVNTSQLPGDVSSSSTAASSHAQQQKSPEQRRFKIFREVSVKTLLRTPSNPRPQNVT
mmetsp:Transcript_12611/g.21555  ORF Transcript_12611/g.21555 Transcript_12611/m.21555 type:complete len:296 (+) Transcript_12611:66-953(+)|eukprot:CAMPEP_0184692548 /NCGR_PEP_ID=MMETSP0313-20130426/984_1 /TAXON_ID=2792 /ORGANISM="Porphyridium aerugineum, Strain SAG 1380-2" /LENGTH=295 /DNA_ID=CAMNT_0027150385 /DNA_START=304 /DNA_END=1191 /DNA_ORIENTATION=+